MQSDAMIEAQLDRHFMRIVNMCRGGITDDEIRITAGFCQVPEWLVMRIGRDMGVLTPDQNVRYNRIIERMAQREAKLGTCRNCKSTLEACDDRLMSHPKRCCPDCKEHGPAICHKKAKES